MGYLILGIIMGVVIGVLAMLVLALMVANKNSNDAMKKIHKELNDVNEIFKEGMKNDPKRKGVS